MNPFLHRFRIQHSALILLTGMLTGTTSSWGNDYFFETGIGGLTIGKSDNISMRSERLEISKENIQVEYVFINHSKKDEVATVAFPLPPTRVCNAEDRDDGPCEDNVLRMTFDTWIDGKKLALGKDIKVIDKIVGTKSERDWTEYLKKNVFGKKNADGTPISLRSLPVPMLDEMEEAGLIERQRWCEEVGWSEVRVGDQLRYKLNVGGMDITDALQKTGYKCLSYPDCCGHVNSLELDHKKMLEKKGWAKFGPIDDIFGRWKTQKTYLWTQKFRAGVPLKVKHRYFPYLGMSYIVNGDGIGDGEFSNGTIKKFCIDPPTKKTLMAMLRSKPKGESLGYEWVQYILTTANSWKGPIENFTLVLKKKSPKEIISTCFDGLKKTSPTTFEANRKNFKPERDLDVSFFN